MRVLLLGEYSRLHNTLKEGLVALDHEVVLLGDGDGFKNYPVDLSIRARTVKLPVLNLIRKAIYRVFKVDLIEIEQGLRFWGHLKKLKGFDAVQLINERPIKTTPSFERFLLKKLFKQLPNCYLLSCGADTFSVRYMMEGNPKYSVLTPFLKNQDLHPKFVYMLNYLGPNHQKTHKLIQEHCSGIIATDFDYVQPLQGHPKFKGLVPNPVNCSFIPYTPLKISEKINVFLGVNEGNRHAKGINYFETALENLPVDISEKINIIRVSNLPYKEYTTLNDSAHILLDQVHSFDQGYNALEAMAKGKVVFTGAEEAFLSHYRLKEDEVCINALPNAVAIEKKMIGLIKKPDHLMAISKNARRFIENHHDHIKVASSYVAIWKNN